MTQLYLRLLNRVKEEEGQTLVEYVLIAGLMAVVIIGILLTTFQGPVSEFFRTLGNYISTDITGNIHP